MRGGLRRGAATSCHVQATPTRSEKAPGPTSVPGAGWAVPSMAYAAWTSTLSFSPAFRTWSCSASLTNCAWC